MTDTEHVDIIGKVVESVWVDDRGYWLALVFLDGTSATWEAVGDCCAHCWIEGIELYGFKGKLLSIEAETFDSREMDAGDYEDKEFITFKTEKGRLIIDLRTSHNGYYGGQLERRHDQMESVKVEGHWRQVLESVE